MKVIRDGTRGKNVEKKLYFVGCIRKGLCYDVFRKKIIKGGYDYGRNEKSFDQNQ